MFIAKAHFGTMTLALVGGAASAIAAPPCDPSCVEDFVLEPEPCGEQVNAGCDGGSDCCAPTSGLDCNDPDCVALVCPGDSFCCVVAWDQICAEMAIQLCFEGCFLPNPSTTPITAGQTLCGTFWAEAGLRDADWYSFEVGTLSEVTITLQGCTPVEIGVFTANGELDCYDAMELDVATTSLPGVPAVLSTCLAPGEQWIVVRPDTDDGISCGTDESRYVLTLDVAPAECVPSVPVNDVCAGAVPVFEGANSVSTQGAHSDGLVLTADCPSSQSGYLQGDVWFTFTAPRDGTVRVATCGSCAFDAILLAYRGSCEDLELVACDAFGLGCPFNDPQVDFDAIAGEEFLLRLGASDSSEGEAVLSVSYLPCVPPYSMELVPTTSAPVSSARGISDSGELVGVAGTSSFKFAFRWTPRFGYVQVARAGSTNDALVDVNESGMAVGWFTLGGVHRPAQAPSSLFEQLPALGTCAYGEATGINANGDIIGKLTQSACKFAVRWVDLQPELLPVPAQADEPMDINSSGTICGWGYLTGAYLSEQGWLLSDGMFQWVPAPQRGQGLRLTGLNDAEQVVGHIVLARSHIGEQTQPILWEEGRVTSIPVPAGYIGGRAVAINNEGVIVGAWDRQLSTSSATRFAFVQRPGGPPLPLNDLIGPSTGADVRDVFDINQSGQIAAEARLKGKPVAARLTPSAPSGDLTCDGVVDGTDLGLLLAAWGPCLVNLSCSADFTLDGEVDGADLGVLLATWGAPAAR